VPATYSNAARDENSELREYLREWRRTTAKDNGIAAFIVMHDTSLDELCRTKPKTLAELRGVSGFGERKTELYGPQILEALESFRRGARVSERTEEKEKPAEETMRLLEEGKSFEEIARLRGRQLSSVYSLVADLVERGELEFDPEWIASEKLELIEAACGRLGMEKWKPLKEAVPEEISYGEIRLVAAYMKSQAEEK